MSSETNERPPDARLIFATGDYHHALVCYQKAKQLTLDMGICFANDVGGRINSPRHPRWPEPHGAVPNELLDDPNWEASIDLWFDNPERFAWIRSEPLPEGLRLEVREP